MLALVGPLQQRSSGAPLCGIALPPYAPQLAHMSCYAVQIEIAPPGWKFESGDMVGPFAIREEAGLYQSLAWNRGLLAPSRLAVVAPPVLDATHNLCRALGSTAIAPDRSSASAANPAHDWARVAMLESIRWCQHERVFTTDIRA